MSLDKFETALEEYELETAHNYFDSACIEAFSTEQDISVYEMLYDFNEYNFIEVLLDLFKGTLSSSAISYISSNDYLVQSVLENSNLGYIFEYTESFIEEYTDYLNDFEFMKRGTLSPTSIINLFKHFACLSSDLDIPHFNRLVDYSSRETDGINAEGILAKMVETMFDIESEGGEVRVNAYDIVLYLFNTVYFSQDTIDLYGMAVAYSNNREVSRDIEDYLPISVLKYMSARVIKDLITIYPDLSEIVYDHITQFKDRGVTEVLREYRDDYFSENFRVKKMREVYHTLSKELLYKIRSYMIVKGLEELNIKRVFDPKHPLYKEFGSFTEDKQFLLTNFVFRLSDLNTVLNTGTESDKFSIGYDVYDDSNQQHLKKNNMVIQLNFKEEYLNKIFDIKGSEFKEFYEELSKISMISGHPVLPIPGRTYGWARIYVLEQGWLINEIQTDWKHLIAFCKQLSTLKPGDEFQGVKIDARISQFFQTAEQREWGKFIGETMLENFDELIMSSILNVARRNDVHHIYMLTPKNQPSRGSLGQSMLKDLYHTTPRKFKFHKVVTNLGAGDQEYWYRTARKV